MKSWLTKFQISAALDAGKPLPPALNEALRTSEDLRRFKTRSQVLGQALSEAKPQVEPPASLHRSIMRSVAAAAKPAAERPSLHLLRWAAAPAFVAVLAVALWNAANPAVSPSNSAPLASVSTTLELGSNVPRTLAPALVAPLSDELDHLNQDLDHTAQFLLASLP